MLPEVCVVCAYRMNAHALYHCFVTSVDFCLCPDCGNPSLDKRAEL